MLIMHLAPLYIYIVPDGPPQFLTAVSVNSSSVYVSWGDVTCADRNGEITGYSINYTSTSESGVDIAQADTSGKIVTGLSACIVYNFRVAAMNIIGTGPFSHAVTISLGTHNKRFISYLFVY